MTDVFLAKDTHGYRALLQGDQTMFLIPVGTPIKLLTLPQRGISGGQYVRVLSGEYEGYAGWIFTRYFQFTGPDESAFPPED